MREQCGARSTWCRVNKVSYSGPVQGLRARLSRRSQTARTCRKKGPRFKVCHHGCVGLVAEKIIELAGHGMRGATLHATAIKELEAPRRKA